MSKIIERVQIRWGEDESWADYDRETGGDWTENEYVYFGQDLVTVARYELYNSASQGFAPGYCAVRVTFTDGSSLEGAVTA